MQCKVGRAEYHARGPSHSCEAARVNSEDESLMLCLLPPACSNLIGGLDGELGSQRGWVGERQSGSVGLTYIHSNKDLLESIGNSVQYYVTI